MPRTQGFVHTLGLRGVICGIAIIAIVVIMVVSAMLEERWYADVKVEGTIARVAKEGCDDTRHYFMLEGKEMVFSGVARVSPQIVFAREGQTVMVFYQKPEETPRGSIPILNFIIIDPKQEAEKEEGAK